MSVVGNEAGQGRPASGRRFERRQGGHSEIKRAAPPGCRAAVKRETRLDYPSGRPRLGGNRRRSLRLPDAGSHDRDG